ncbi:hypothetical protein [Bacillus suaedaesalsae]|uniref:Uncharacterized protein n=1 Tax=Bacillus suaedaesalsae TaxID=2810349 RepID=A0ABS2DKE3_9BACI|nr:hypothetical protein [Bacillus suaedaesalsae]MBM6618964.1 hypothetical protein [Bacillus suaedaesalsae]
MIGIDMDQEQLTLRLNDCLLSEDEMNLDWKSFNGEDYFSIMRKKSSDFETSFKLNRVDTGAMYLLSFFELIAG